jgi:CubicO group peptidase (beta-lactamase class C family)
MNRIAQVAAAALLLAVPAFATAELSELRTAEEHRAMFRAVTPENFDDGGAISRYVWKNTPAFYGMATIARTGPVRELPVRLRADVAHHEIEVGGEPLSLDRYVSDSPLVDSMIVLYEGSVVYEAYTNMEPWDRHYTWSVGKVYASTALAILEASERVNVDEPVETYLPELGGTAWEGTTVRNIVNMASGIDCRDSDGYQNVETCIYRFEETLNLTAPVHEDIPTTMEALQAMGRSGPQGERNEYVSANTHVTGLIVERVYGTAYWIALQELIFDRIGPEADAFHYVSRSGVPAVHGGLFLRLRDVARFGELFIPASGLGGELAGHLDDLQSDNGIELSEETRANFAARYPALADDLPSHAAWQWDRIWPDGGMYKGGYSGQGLYVDPHRELVVAFFGTADTEGNRNELMSAARQLATSALFDNR